MECIVDLELSHEGVHSDDGEDQPKDDAHRQHVEDAGNTNYIFAIIQEWKSL